MDTQQILSSNLTKTDKIKALLALGLTRKQVAELTGGNYGFVQNIFAKMYPEQVRSRQQAPLNFTAFNRKFGVEIEAYGVTFNRLETALRQAGIEVQAEGYNHTTRPHWKIVTDESIRMPNAFELVSPILEGQNGIEQLQTVCRVLEALNAKIARTCGLHIHFDAAGLTASHVKNILTNYAAYETFIDSFMPESRRANNNTYCKSIKTYIERIKTCNTIEKMTLKMPSRYMKVNLQSYLRHRSIEFRQHGGTIEFEKITNWITFLHNLVSYSERNTARTASIETLATFQQPETITYIHNRISQLSA